MSGTLHDLNAREARDRRLAPLIAKQTGLSYAVVRGRLVRAHGRTLLRNLFADVWSKLDAVQRPRLRTAPVSPPPVRPPMPPRGGRPARAHTIHRVRQEFSTSCGVAVVAMFARVSHREALSVMFPRPRPTYYTWLKDVKRALDHFQIPYAPRWHRFRSWEEIPTTSLVKVRWRNADGSTGLHWVIFQRRANGEWRVIDPDSPRHATLSLNGSGLARFKGLTYLGVQAREG